MLFETRTSIADFGAIIVLSIFFSGEGGTGPTLLLLGSVFALAPPDCRWLEPGVARRASR